MALKYAQFYVINSVMISWMQYETQLPLIPYCNVSVYIYTKSSTLKKQDDGWRVCAAPGASNMEVW